MSLELVKRSTQGHSHVWKLKLKGAQLGHSGNMETSHGKTLVVQKVCDNMVSHVCDVGVKGNLSYNSGII